MMVLYYYLIQNQCEYWLILYLKQSTFVSASDEACGVSPPLAWVSLGSFTFSQSSKNVVACSSIPTLGVEFNSTAFGVIHDASHEAFVQVLISDLGLR